MPGSCAGLVPFGIWRAAAEEARSAGRCVGLDEVLRTGVVRAGLAPARVYARTRIATIAGSAAVVPSAEVGSWRAIRLPVTVEHGSVRASACGVPESE